MEFFNHIISTFKNITVIDVVDIVLFAVIVYCAFLFFKRHNAQWYAYFVMAFSLTVFLLCFTKLRLISTAFFVMLGMLGVLTVIIFSHDIKRDFWLLMHKTHAPSVSIAFNIDDLNRIITEIVKATQNMSKKDIGALMIFPKSDVDKNIIESGVIIGAAVTSQIIESIFFPNSAIHDGAMFIKNDKIIAAGCFLPLSQQLNIPKELGTRHRAAMGLTEQYLDAIAITVSEETGIISCAYQGVLKRYLDTSQLTEILEVAMGLKDIDSVSLFKDIKPIQTDEDEE